MLPRLLPPLLAWLFATVLAAFFGSVIQTQVNLAGLVALGVEIPFQLRVDTTVDDLAGFAPLWAAIVAAGFLLAFVVAAFLSRLLPTWRVSLHALAGATAVLAALLIMQSMLGIQPIAAARSLTGLVGMSLAGALGGLVYALNTAPPTRETGQPAAAG